MFRPVKEKREWTYYKNLSSKEYIKHLKIIYKNAIKKELNITSPKRLTEKIQWLKLNDNIERKRIYTNKLTAPIMVQQDLKNLKNNPLLYKTILGIYNSFDEINFDSLPNSFVIKANHGSSMNHLVFNKESLINNKEELIKLKYKTQKWLETNYAYVSGFELQYDYIKPQLFIENLYIDNDYRLTEVSVYCFNGSPEIIQLTTFCNQDTCFENRMYQFNTFYDKYWQIQEFSVDEKPCKLLMKPIRHFYPILKISQELSKSFKFVRVDFLLANRDKDLYFQEMTFTPYSGFRRIYPDIYDRKLGDLLEL